MRSRIENYSLTLKIITSMAMVGYIILLMVESAALYTESSELTGYFLFSLFLVGYILLWKHKVISGMVFLIWYSIQWYMVFLVWEKGMMTLLLGLPIAALGLLILLNGIKKKPNKSSPSI
ncbi:hypothetical protein NE848_10905 [Gramella jeungdoensis]|uniref:Uncharacterized protein n=1 Tax=Gramella jeungdoensis TaxID=708091 RepID=A0ABT0Z2C1_9FLAO|nr:hypothetical protein [Gramella jeungdoensis]MCM8569891.1 hypothetical protein [Gramella jeungdoensis]